MGIHALTVGPVIPVSDMAASRAFYEDRLGLDGMFIAWFRDPGDQVISVFELSSARPPPGKNLSTRPTAAARR
jgi:catechol 2,3-dioxygenase-like lactoylglutathione lyase family enzyme